MTKDPKPEPQHSETGLWEYDVTVTGMMQGIKDKATLHALLMQSLALPVSIFVQVKAVSVTSKPVAIIPAGGLKSI